MKTPLLQFTKKGIYCQQGEFYIDPWRVVDNAVITHGHSDHARRGMKHYLAQDYSVPILKKRLGNKISIQGLRFKESIYMNGVELSMHPAGHVIGSAQIRVAYNDEVWVASGDYKVEDDGLCTPFEVVKCDSFITECTFGLPIFQWQKQAKVIEEIGAWWTQNKSKDCVSMIAAYSLGKAQRLGYSLRGYGKIYVHDAIWQMNKAIAENGISINKNIYPLDKVSSTEDLKGSLILSSSKNLGIANANTIDIKTATCSGWNQVKKTSRKLSNTNFVMSDHADWNGLINTIESTGAENIICTHGYSEQFARYLCSKGLNGMTEHTQFKGEENEVL